LAASYCLLTPAQRRTYLASGTAKTGMAAKTTAFMAPPYNRMAVRIAA
jgi:hypothetical protein